jgi:organic hydroperoxide reductase OsmC/OhrA
MSHEHHYRATLAWSGAAVSPTIDYKAYSREYTVTIDGKPALIGSADTTFRGDSSRHNPEDLLLIALCACHMLSYLALCARGGVRVIRYEDQAEGTMAMKDGRIRFTQVMLRPRVVIDRSSDLTRAMELHEQAHEECFIANSVNFPVEHEARVVLAE